MGDTITDDGAPADKALAGFKELKPMVFAGLYPTEANQYGALRDAVEKLRLNDASLICEPETSQALGFGFRAGFLGLLHMEIAQERLEREFGLDLIVTAPTVAYRVRTTSGKQIMVDNPSLLPPENEIEAIEEPFIMASIHTPEEFLGPLFKLCEEKRGVQHDLKYLGYASLDYDFLDFRAEDLLKLDVRINAEVVDALSIIVHREKAYERGRALCEKMRQLIPRQMFEVAIQASVGAKIIARETVKPLRKNVTAKCYGGDITRKRKLLEKQKEGKKRMKQVGRVEIPQEAFLALLKMGE
jgi:GTP-binding protein LepA